LASARCAYATHWVAIKYRWRLSIDPAEKTKLASSCPRPAARRRSPCRPTPAKTSLRPGDRQSRSYRPNTHRLRSRTTCSMCARLARRYRSFPPPVGPMR
jgi:hypothetical protein